LLAVAQQLSERKQT